MGCNKHSLGQKLNNSHVCRTVWKAISNSIKDEQSKRPCGAFRDYWKGELWIRLQGTRIEIARKTNKIVMFV